MYNVVLLSLNLDLKNQSDFKHLQIVTFYVWSNVCILYIKYKYENNYLKAMTVPHTRYLIYEILVSYNKTPQT